ncbi:hypothetical protein [Rhodoplanes roseus]|uniref:Uncharacterized protein n=1 Tax=Rhodoplanes roseus TaxID=29409 RepID=A0A327L1M2_9BRAD|nr:hypothetical protein [Rhodoplanes roseus]RAI41598.1 hypothetical protein CH341_21285 [Rhodoplanes roseus]
MPRPTLLISATLLGAVSFYLVGLATGAVTLVGYERGNAVSRGLFVESSGLLSRFTMPPVYVPAGRALRADYTVDAKVGSLWVVIMQPFWSKVRATAYVAGERSGSIVFVAETAGWYEFYVDPTPVFGHRCHTPGADMVDILTGRDGCPRYDVRYTVSWHLADGAETGPRHVTVPIAGPDRQPPSARIGP